MVGSVHVATQGSVYATSFELQLLIVPEHHVHIPPRPLLRLRRRVRLRLSVRVSSRNGRPLEGGGRVKGHSVRSEHSIRIRGRVGQRDGQDPQYCMP